MGRSNPSGTMSYPKQIPVVPVKVHLNKKFSGQQSMSTEIPPNKKYKNFHYLEGVSTELQDSFENTKSNFRSPSKRTTDTGTDKSNQKISTRGKRKKKKNYIYIYMISVKLTASVSFIYCYFIPVSLLA